MHIIMPCMNVYMRLKCEKQKAKNEKGYDYLKVLS